MGGKQARDSAGAACELALQVGGLQPGETQSQASRVQGWGGGLCRKEREQGLQGERRPGHHARRSEAACVAGGGETVLGVKGIGLGSCGLRSCGRLRFLSALGLGRQVVLGR